MMLAVAAILAASPMLDSDNFIFTRGKILFTRGLTITARGDKATCTGLSPFTQMEFDYVVSCYQIFRP